MESQESHLLDLSHGFWLPLWPWQSRVSVSVSALGGNLSFFLGCIEDILSAFGVLQFRYEMDEHFCAPDPVYSGFQKLEKIAGHCHFKPYTPTLRLNVCCASPWPPRFLVSLVFCLAL